MTRSITTQAETVGGAIKEALEILQLTMDDVHVHVKRPAGTSMFGLRKVLAEVTVNEKEKKESVQEEAEEILAGVRIHNERLEVRFGKQHYPIIVPSTGVELRINGTECTERTIVLSTDSVECSARSEDIAAHFVIRLDEHLMIATAIVTPGKRITRTLQDSPWKQVLNIQVSEKVDVYNELTTEQLVEELNNIGIDTGISLNGIRQAVNTLECTEIIVARGIPPIESQDARLDIHLNFKKLEDDEDEDELVDFREHNFIPTVKAGQLIATYIPAVQGSNGKNLKDETYKVKPPKDIIVRPLDTVDSVVHKLYAKIDGRPVIEWRSKLAKIYVNREYRHASNVNLESGNIHFEGDVWIGGSVHPSMFIAASGIITIMKNCTKASIRGTKSVFIQGSIFSSTVTVGIQEKVITMMVNDLTEVLLYLRNIESALVQIFTLRK
ncbi:FapA family protein [Sporosarcina ureae]|uniref:FapA family protein n=1 Tax=Sporosarcina ureae TaxID=1571 RepID=UPI0026F0E309|nr:FapA family protein [Sporosarcina ureae]